MVNRGYDGAVNARRNSIQGVERTVPSVEVVNKVREGHIRTAVLPPGRIAQKFTFRDGNVDALWSLYCRSNHSFGLPHGHSTLLDGTGLKQIIDSDAVLTRALQATYGLMPAHR